MLSNRLIPPMRIAENGNRIAENGNSDSGDQEPTEVINT